MYAAGLALGASAAPGGPDGAAALSKKAVAAETSARRTRGIRIIKTPEMLSEVTDSRIAAAAREEEEGDVAAAEVFTARQSEGEEAAGGAGASLQRISAARRDCVDSVVPLLFTSLGQVSDAVQVEEERETAAAAEAARETTGTFSFHAATVQPSCRPAATAADASSPSLAASSSLPCWVAPSPPSVKFCTSGSPGAHPPFSSSSSAAAALSTSSRTSSSSSMSASSSSPAATPSSPLSSPSPGSCTSVAFAAMPTALAVRAAGCAASAATPAVAAECAATPAAAAVTVAATPAGATPAVDTPAAATAVTAAATPADATRAAAAASSACTLAAVNAAVTTPAAVVAAAIPPGAESAATPAAVVTPTATPAVAVTPAAARLLGSGRCSPDGDGLLISEEVLIRRGRRRLWILILLAGKVLPVLLSLFSFLLTFWYYTSMVRLTQHLQQANTTSAIYAEYSSAKTLAALELLEDFIERHGLEHYPFCYLHLRQQKTAEGRELDRARRHLTQWFSRIQYFYESGYLHAAHMQQFPGPQRTRYFLDLVEPLEYVSRKTTGRKHAAVFDFLRKVYNLNEHRLDPVFVQRVKRLIKQGRRRREDSSSSSSIGSSNWGCCSSTRETRMPSHEASSKKKKTAAGCSLTAAAAADQTQHDRAERKKDTQQQPHSETSSGEERTADIQKKEDSSMRKTASLDPEDSKGKEEEEVDEEAVHSRDCAGLPGEAAAAAAREMQDDTIEEEEGSAAPEEGSKHQTKKEEREVRWGVVRDMKGNARTKGRARCKEEKVSVNAEEEREGGRTTTNKRRKKEELERRDVLSKAGRSLREGEVAGRMFHARKAGVPHWPRRGAREIQLFEGFLLESAEVEEVEDDEEDDEEEDFDEEEELGGSQGRSSSRAKKECETGGRADRKHDLVCKPKTTAAVSGVSERDESTIPFDINHEKDSTAAGLSFERAPAAKDAAAATAKETPAAVTVEEEDEEQQQQQKPAAAAASSEARLVAAPDGSSKTTATADHSNRHEEAAARQVADHYDEL